MADALLCMVETIDGALTTYSARSLVSSAEVLDLLLDLRVQWREAALADPCCHD
jgi:hypothetical protein